MTLGRFVREARERKRLTIRALGKLVGCSAPFLSDIEHDRRCPEKRRVAALEAIVGRMNWRA